ncbi:MAG: hypothetical protein ACR2FO_03640 [Actinomycetota bacterium]
MSPWTRREFLRAGVAVPAGVLASQLAAACGTKDPRQHLLMNRLEPELVTSG